MVRCQIGLHGATRKRVINLSQNARNKKTRDLFKMSIVTFKDKIGTNMHKLESTVQFQISIRLALTPFLSIIGLWIILNILRRSLMSQWYLPILLGNMGIFYGNIGINWGNWGTGLHYMHQNLWRNIGEILVQIWKTAGSGNIWMTPRMEHWHSEVLCNKIKGLRCMGFGFGSAPLLKIPGTYR